MTHLDLFSGIGGFAFAAREVWGDEHEIVGFCEINQFCQQVLKKHWPEARIYGDIRELARDRVIADSDRSRHIYREHSKYSAGGHDKAQLCDLLTGGFPCQPFSCAGKRRGAADDRYLWPEMLRVIKEFQPRWIIGENVTGILGQGRAYLARYMARRV